MHSIIRYIRKNKIKLIGTIIFIIILYSIIISANQLYENREKEKISSQNQTTTETEKNIYVSDKECEKIIEIFLKNCTKENYEKAYSYLSEECKSKKFSTLEEFKNNYCIANSLKDKGYEIKKIKKYCYEIKFNDYLSTGKSNTEKVVHSYTIKVIDKENLKISID